MDAKSKESNNVSISINPEIREYTESIFWGLTLRQFLFSLAGCIVSVGIFFFLRGAIGMEAVSWACIFGMLPCALLGFVKYHGMPAEQLLVMLIKSEIMMPRELPFRSVNLLEILTDQRSGRRKENFNECNEENRER